LIDYNQVNLKLGVPTCFFGQYETDEVDSKGNLAKKELSDAFGFDINATELSYNDNRSILIVHDLEKMNFCRKKGDQKLTLTEARAVLREIAGVNF